MIFLFISSSSSSERVACGVSSVFGSSELDVSVVSFSEISESSSGTDSSSVVRIFSTISGGVSGRLISSRISE